MGLMGKASSFSFGLSVGYDICKSTRSYISGLKGVGISLVWVWKLGFRSGISLERVRKVEKPTSLSFYHGGIDKPTDNET